MSRTELVQVMPWRERVLLEQLRGTSLFEAHADQGLLQGKQQETTLHYSLLIGKIA